MGDALLFPILEGLGGSISSCMAAAWIDSPRSPPLLRICALFYHCVRPSILSSGGSVARLGALALLLLASVGAVYADPPPVQFVTAPPAAAIKRTIDVLSAIQVFGGNR